MQPIRSILDDLEKLRERYLIAAQTNHDKDYEVLGTHIVAALEKGHESFLRSLESERFEAGIQELIDALYVFPVPQVWTLLSILIAMDSGIKSGGETLCELVNWYGRKEHRGFDNLMKLVFPEVYGPRSDFRKCLQGGLSKQGFETLRNSPHVINLIVNWILDYAESIKQNGDKFVELGEFVELYGESIDQGLRKFLGAANDGP